jgi:hypothetical protein
MTAFERICAMTGAVAIGFMIGYAIATLLFG